MNVEAMIANLRREADERAKMMKNPCEAHRNIKAKHCPVCLAAEVDRLRKALESVKDDIEGCDWRCTRCGVDPEMKDTDVYMYVTEALKRDV